MHKFQFCVIVLSPPPPTHTHKKKCTHFQNTCILYACIQQIFTWIYLAIPTVPSPQDTYFRVRLGLQPSVSLMYAMARANSSKIALLKSVSLTSDGSRRAPINNSCSIMNKEEHVQGIIWITIKALQALLYSLLVSYFFVVWYALLAWTLLYCHSTMACCVMYYFMWRVGHLSDCFISEMLFSVLSLTDTPYFHCFVVNSKKLVILFASSTVV